jgi:transporter family-2 protein
MEALFIPISLFAGGLLAVQAGANTQLSKATGSPFAATTIQVLIAGALLLAIAIASGAAGALINLPRAPWWHALGGLATAIYVASTILLFPRLGAVVTVGLFIAGQMTASLALDAFGILGVPQQVPGAMSVAGTLAVFAGAAAIVLGQKDASNQLGVAKVGWIVLAVVAGAVLPVQGAVNGLLRNDIGAPLAVGTVSFAVATLTMGLVLWISLALWDQPRPTLAGLARMPWWGWLGAACGATYVVTVFSAMPAIGTAAAIGLTVAGQQIASLFVDRFGLFRLPKREIKLLRYAGVAIMLIGVALIQIF